MNRIWEAAIGALQGPYLRPGIASRAGRTSHKATQERPVGLRLRLPLAILRSITQRVLLPSSRLQEGRAAFQQRTLFVCWGTPISNRRPMDAVPIPPNTLISIWSDFSGTT